MLILYLLNPLDVREYEFIIENTNKIGVRISSFILEKTSEKLILDLKENTTQLEKASKEAMAASNAKSDFLATMSHEIRTPMNGVIGTTALLLKTKLNHRQRQYVETTMNSAEALLTIINDILDFSKIEAGKLDLENIPFNLELLAYEVCQSLATRSKNNKIEIVLHYLNNVPRNLIGDSGRVRQILLNLLGNAEKFTTEGFISLTVSVDRKAKDSTILLFKVKDTGVGISEANLEKIFNQFDQADNSVTRNYGGTGLGLSITKKLCELMHGDITVKSKQGKGSTFTFTIKLQEDKAAINEENKQNDVLENVKVLIVDDLEAASASTTEQISNHVGKLEIVNSAREALDKLRTAIDDKNEFDIVIIDDEMPRNDGEMLLENIAKDKLLENGISIYLASCPRRGDASRLKNLGISGYLNKPSISADLLTVITTAWKAKINNETIPVVTRYSIKEDGIDHRLAEIFTNIDVLLVEDNQVNVMVATAMIQALGCTVTPAGNGVEALDLLKHRTFDLIFMDCQMPTMDGYTATKKIRELEHSKNLKHNIIIALTANAMKGDMEKCFDAGMDDYLSKPIKEILLQKMMSKWIEQEVINSDSMENTAKDEDESNANSELQILDLKPFNALREMFADKFIELVKQNQTSMNENYSRVIAGIKDNDFDLIERAGHSLKSSSRQLGSLRLGDIAEKIEMSAKEHNQGKISELIKDFESVRIETERLIDKQL